MLRIAITVTYRFLAMIPFDQTLESQQQKHEASGSSFFLWLETQDTELTVVPRQWRV